MRPFLLPLQEHGEDYPCTHRHRCGCRHRILYTSPDDISAVCTCTPPACPPIRLRPTDTLIHTLNLRKLGNAFRTAFDFALPVCDAPPSPHSCRVGDWGAARSPVIFSVPPGDGNDVLIELETLCLASPAPSILLIPGQLPGPALAESVMHRHGSVIIPLADKVTVTASGRFEVTEPIDGILAEFTRRQAATAANLPKVIEGIHRKIEADAHDRNVLRQERDELAKLHADGYMKFLTKIAPTDFQAFAAIMVHGTRNAAVKALGTARRTFYTQVDRWQHMGPEYSKMYQLAKWRNAANRSVKVPLDVALRLTGIPDDIRDYPALLQQILEALALQDPYNWRAVNREVSEIIRDELPR